MRPFFHPSLLIFGLAAFASQNSFHSLHAAVVAARDTHRAQLQPAGRLDPAFRAPAFNAFLIKHEVHRKGVAELPRASRNDAWPATRRTG